MACCPKEGESAADQGAQVHTDIGVWGIPVGRGRYILVTDPKRSIDQAPQNAYRRKSS